MSSCTFCGQKALLECATCAQNFCTSKHEDFHRFPDSGKCFPFQILEKPEVGRCVVASRDILAGETIFEEVPIAVGPNQETLPICLFCHQEVSSGFVCPTCRYPFCSQSCVDQIHDVSSVECRVLSRMSDPSERNFQTAQVNSQDYHVVLPLRILVVRSQKPELHSMMNHFMDHNAERKISSSYWSESQSKVVEPLKQYSDGQSANQWSEDDIHRAIGILEVNAYEIHATAAGAGFRALFPLASLLSHSCISNTHHFWSQHPPYRNKCVATVDIPVGKEIASKYVQPIQSTWNRRSNLKAGWFFDCRCHRCSDPSEAGSHVGSLICPKCGQICLAKNPLDWETEWKCDGCSNSVRGSQVRADIKSILGRLESTVKESRHDEGKYMDLICEAEQMFHPHHEVICQICKWLLPVFCRSPGLASKDFPLEKLTRKFRLARNQLQVANIVSPGLTKVRAKLIFEFVDTTMALKSLGETLSIPADQEMMALVEEAFEALSLDLEISKFEECILYSLYLIREEMHLK